MAEWPMRWKPRTRQDEGREVEKVVLKREGFRPHPGSGAGHIKHDGSDDDTLCEVKLTSRSFTLNAAYLHGLMAQAVRQGKEPLLLIEFDDPKHGLTVEVRPTPRRRA